MAAKFVARTCTFPARWPYSPSDFTRMDESVDTKFYSAPRFVHHIDDNAIASLKQYYASVLRPRDRVLDLASSWVSHLPDELTDLQVTGVGLNEAELQANERLSAYYVKDLNQDPSLAMFIPVEIKETQTTNDQETQTTKDQVTQTTQDQETQTEQHEKAGLFDAVICNVSIDYLTRPRAICTALARVLRPGGTVHMAVSNRCFPTKVVARWLRVSETDRLQMVADYLHFAVSEDASRLVYTDVRVVQVVKPFWGGDPLHVVTATRI